MKRTSTPEHEFELPFSWDDMVEQFILTYTQNNQIVLEFTEKDLGDKLTINKTTNTLIASLTQEDTAKFSVGTAIAELKVWTKSEKSLISEDIPIYMHKVQNERLFK